MADSGTLPLLRPLLPRPSIFLSFPNLHVWRFRNPKSPFSRSHLVYFSSSRSTVASVKIIPLNHRRFSYKICAVTEKGGGYRRTEGGKRGRKQQQLWEELLGDSVENEDGDSGSYKLDLWKILEEIVDNVWILKAFRSYGYLLPFILLSLFLSTGPKAFLVSLGIAIGPSLLFYAFQKLIGWGKRRRASLANQFGIDEEEEEMEIRNNRVRYNASSVTRSSARMASRFGGWDEIEDAFETVPEEPRMRKPMRKRKKVRREESAEPLLLRLLVSLFPFLSSFTNMLNK